MRESRVLCILNETKGYALPSILFVIICVSVIILSILWLQSLQRYRVLAEAASVKAEYAAQDGIVYSTTRLNTRQEEINKFLGNFEKIELKGGGLAVVETAPWGLFWRVRSVGRFANATTVRIALLADTPSQQFNQALIFAQPAHQLVLAGSSLIRGDVQVGQSGVATGQLKEYTTPHRLQVDGAIVKKINPTFPLFQPPYLNTQIGEYKKTLYTVDRGIDGSNKIFSAVASRGAPVMINSILDSVDVVCVKGDAVIDARVTRFDTPLSITVAGNLLIDNEAQIAGFVKILSTGKITVAPKASIEHAILFSTSSIHIQEHTSLSAQLIAPSIVLSEGANVRYPSVLLSIPPEKPAPLKQSISISDKAIVEGLVALLSPNGGAPQDGLVVLKPTAIIIGALYSENSITLDGTVRGTVMARSFYFYEAPTTYLGWLRSASIDRTTLPNGFLVPPGFSEQPRLQILEWL